MPFVEIENPHEEKWIYIYSSGTVRISIKAYRDHFVGKRIRFFHDEENKKLGLQPADKGYKICNANQSHEVKCAAVSRLLVGKYPAEWSEKHKMLVISYG